MQARSGVMAWMNTMDGDRVDRTWVERSKERLIDAGVACKTGVDDGVGEDSKGLKKGDAS